MFATNRHTEQQMFDIGTSIIWRCFSLDTIYGLFINMHRVEPTNDLCMQNASAAESSEGSSRSVYATHCLTTSHIEYVCLFTVRCPFKRIVIGIRISFWEANFQSSNVDRKTNIGPDLYPLNSLWGTLLSPIQTHYNSWTFPRLRLLGFLSSKLKASMILWRNSCNLC